MKKIFITLSILALNLCLSLSCVFAEGAPRRVLSENKFRYKTYSGTVKKDGVCDVTYYIKIRYGISYNPNKYTITYVSQPVVIDKNLQTHGYIYNSADSYLDEQSFTAKKDSQTKASFHWSFKLVSIVQGKKFTMKSFDDYATLTV